MQTSFIQVLRTIFRLVTFQLSREEFLQFNRTHLAVGLICTLLAGIGRTLHNARVEWWQHLGLGSLAYVFVLALLLWLVLLPLRIANLSYRHVLTFVALTSPTGFIYAVPVEHFMNTSDATGTRFWFLALVATWRVALWFYYLLFFCELDPGSTVVITVLPLCLIVTGLTALNLDRVVFEIMGGSNRVSTDDGAFFALFILTALSELAFVPLLIGYGLLIYFRWRKRRQSVIESWGVKS